MTSDQFLNAPKVSKENQNCDQKPPIYIVFEQEQ